MRLSTTTSRPARAFGFENVIDILADAGYDAIDFSFFQKEYYEEIGNDKFFKNLRNYAESKGLVFNQAHAPFASSFEDEDMTKKRFAEITNSMKYASLLGIKNIVVHPCHHMAYCDDGVPEKLFEINMKFYNNLKPYCEEYGIKVALENMWQYIGPQKISHSTCSRPAEFIRYMDELNSDCFTACLDIGHTILCCEDPADFIRALGGKRLGALHVHDVDGINDLHTLPYFGICNWDKVLRALAEVGYMGDLTYEADGIYSSKPEEFIPEIEKLGVKIGRSMIEKFEEYKRGLI